MIAQHPESTWHRMLTDPAGRMVELSTTSYQPSKPIWSWVVAEHSSCYRPGCDTPATEADIDHRIAWPEGPTDIENLWPGCKPDHKAKHAPGFTIEQDTNGSYVQRTERRTRPDLRRRLTEISRGSTPDGLQGCAP